MKLALKLRLKLPCPSANRRLGVECYQVAPPVTF